MHSGKALIATSMFIGECAGELGLAIDEGGLVHGVLSLNGIILGKDNPCWTQLHRETGRSLPTVGSYRRYVPAIDFSGQAGEGGLETYP